MEATFKQLVIDGDNQPVAKGPGRLQTVNMPGMQDIKTTVGHDYTFTILTGCGYQFLHRGDGQYIITALDEWLHGSIEFRDTDTGSAKFADNNPGSVIGEVDRSFRVISRGYRGRIGCNHCVTGARHIKHLMLNSRQMTYNIAFLVYQTYAPGTAGYEQGGNI